jgi:hypothetical protein
MIIFLIWANLFIQGPEVHLLPDLDKIFLQGIIVQYYAAAFIIVFANSYAPPLPINRRRI